MNMNHLPKHPCVSASLFFPLKALRKFWLSSPLQIAWILILLIPVAESNTEARSPQGPAAMSLFTLSEFSRSIYLNTNSFLRCSPKQSIDPQNIMQCVSIDILHFLVTITIPHSSLERHKTILCLLEVTLSYFTMKMSLTYHEIQEKPCQLIHIYFYTYCWEIRYPWINHTFLDISAYIFKDISINRAEGRVCCPSSIIRITFLFGQRWGSFL